MEEFPIEQKQFNNPEKMEGEPVMKNTAEFKDALGQGMLDEAEQFLQEVAQSPEKFPQYDERWLDHRERELFQAYYRLEDWAGAKRIVEATGNTQSKEGRISRLEQLSGMKYDEI